MIERIYIKNHLSFSEIEVKFKKGLSVFTGVSGSGKSVFMSAIMSAFGLSDSEAKVIEADVSYQFEMQEFGIENEEINSFKMTKNNSTRYFINSQAISKKNLTNIANEHIKFLSAKQINEFENERFLNIIDTLANDKEHNENLKQLRQINLTYKKIKNELEKIQNDEKQIEELKEFARFEIEKIKNTNPKDGEFEELMQIKKMLSKKDKIEQAWNKAENIFELEHSVIEALNISDIDSSFFEEAMNALRIARDELNIDELDDINVEEILDRIEDLNSIIKRYGSEKEAIATLRKKEEELQKYENISFEKKNLQAQYSQISEQQDEICEKITNKRMSLLSNLQNIINEYLNNLYMQNITLKIEPTKISEFGKDLVVLTLNQTSLSKLSSGEINRLRLALIASESKITNSGNGVMILDEIDANLSGKEAMSIANVLVQISQFYQIFAISHQPQLSSKANSHFLIEKKDNLSTIKELTNQERINELARMISGEHISNEAIQFAKELLK
ncbi:DNA repair protein RecN [Campylobacter pinnipediorum subsp. pinnipediorum]|uniref:AAA family ATPase n=1 Tax=Campylobacter pinnipediorum TaxID=1965231 RepID=UPI00099590B1|nr:AAA family ATPase [Campylobacter pinnipediorum]AQW84853.1 DNA repair protein RecN [Campylobacter pinnipediorum subsp. pinnipediorum]